PYRAAVALEVERRDVGRRLMRGAPDEKGSHNEVTFEREVSCDGQAHFHTAPGPDPRLERIHLGDRPMTIHVFSTQRRMHVSRMDAEVNAGAGEKAKTREGSGIGTNLGKDGDGREHQG